MKPRLTLLLILVLSACTEQIEIQPNGLLLIRKPVISNVGSTGSVFSARVENLNQSADRHGFIWSLSNDPTLTNSEIEDLGSLSSGEFSAVINSRLAANQTYFVRAFLEQGGSLFLSDVVSFNSQGSDGPTLSTFSPLRGYVNDTITIYGSDFSRTESNQVYFNELPSTVVFHSSDSLLAIVPTDLSENAIIRVSVSNQSSEFETEFELISPLITELSTNLVDFGDYITVSTNELPVNKSSIDLILLSQSGERKQVLNSNIEIDPLRFRIEDDLTFRSYRLILAFNNQEYVFDEVIRLVEPTFHSISGDGIIPGEAVRIYGTGFSPCAISNNLTIDGDDVEVRSTGNEIISGVEYDYLEFIPKSQLEKVYSSRNVSFEIDVLDFVIQPGVSLEVISPWFRLLRAPFDEVDQSFSYENTGYVFSDNALWSYNNGLWSQLANFPGVTRVRESGFMIDHSIYIGLGRNRDLLYLQDFWKYDIPSNSWSRIADFAGDARFKAVGFSLNGKGYAGTGEGTFFSRSFDFWQYDPTSNSWAMAGDFPFRISTARSFNNKNRGLFVFSNQVYEYDDAAGTWDVVSTLPATTNFDNLTFISTGNTAFAGTVGFDNSVYKAELNSLEWEEISQGPVSAKAIFSVNNKVYFITDSFMFWELDLDR